MTQKIQAHFYFSYKTTPHNYFIFIKDISTGKTEDEAGTSEMQGIRRSVRIQQKKIHYLKEVLLEVTSSVIQIRKKAMIYQKHQGMYHLLVQIFYKI